MIRAGFTIDNPLTGSRTLVLEADAEMNSQGWLLESRCQPGAAPDIAEHLHLTWTETFEIISGKAYYKLDGTQHMAVAGESFTVNPNQRHVHPWCAGDEEMVYRQRNDFEGRTPDAVQEVLGVFATIAQLAAQGKVDSLGRPKNPLQLAVTIKTLGKHGGYDATLPISVQKFLAATLGRLAEALGYRAVAPHFLQDEKL
jgi:hypothetical protein